MFANKLFVTGALSICAAFSVPATASTQGTPGPTSTGTITIDASILPEVRISNLNDVNFDTTSLLRAFNSGADPTAVDLVCVWSNNPDGGYYLTATGDGPGSAFTLNDGTRTISYLVNWDDRSGGGYRALTASTKSPKLTSTATDPRCGGGGNTTANLQVVLPNAEVGAMEATTTYTGVLTLLVTPS